ncbi:MAG: hypothetical protein ACREA0_10225 [bacterium]
MKWFHWHEWGRWHVLQESSPSGFFTVTVQYRQCLTCGFVARRRLDRWGGGVERPDVVALNERLSRERVGEW